MLLIGEKRFTGNNVLHALQDIHKLPRAIQTLHEDFVGKRTEEVPPLLAYKDLLKFSKSRNLVDRHRAWIASSRLYRDALRRDDKKRADVCRKLNVNLYDAIQARKAVKEAICIDQNCVGFSDHEPMGTHNTQDCLAVVLQDPLTSLTALAHLDISNAPDSLGFVLEHFSPRPKHLDMRLIGGRCQYDEDGNIDESSNLTVGARRNEERLAYFLLSNVAPSTELTIQVISCDMYAPDESEQPYCFVFYPETGTLVHAFPGKVLPTRALATGRAWRGQLGCQFTYLPRYPRIQYERGAVAREIICSASDLAGLRALLGKSCLDERKLLDIAERSTTLRAPEFVDLYLNSLQLIQQALEISNNDVLSGGVAVKVGEKGYGRRLESLESVVSRERDALELFGWIVLPDDSSVKKVREYDERCIRAMLNCVDRN